MVNILFLCTRRIKKDFNPPYSVKQFPDIACISLSPKHENSAGIDLVLIGMWTESKVQILQLADFNSILVHSLESVTGPKDIMLIRLEGMSYLMILQGTAAAPIGKDREYDAYFFFAAVCRRWTNAKSQRDIQKLGSLFTQ